MKIQNWKHCMDDFRAYDEQMTRRSQLVPINGVVGMTCSKPYSQASAGKLNDLLDQVRRDELVLDVHETEGFVSVLAYSPLRRGARQVIS